MTHFPSLSQGQQPGPKPNGHAANPPPLPPTPHVTPAHVWKFAHLIHQAKAAPTRQRIPFVDLSRKVREFLTYQVGQHTRDQAARMLWVQGKPGEGKTEGCLLACLQAGFDTAVISPGLFAGETEGASVTALHDLLTELSQWSAAHRIRTVVLIDDFDLSIANVAEDTSKTINTQLLVQECMNLADNRHLYRNADGSNIGFIFTVNDATGMREPLTRPGRSIWHDHVPTTEDKANIAFAMLDPITSAERDLVAALVSKYAARQSVAFWKALYFRMRALHAQKLTETGMPSQADIDAAYGRRLPLVPEIAWTAAKDLRQARAQNWLKTKSWWRR